MPPPRTFDDFLILPEIISKEPLGPIVRHGDDQWLDLVKWTLMGMIEAEEMGITSKNVDEMLKSDIADLANADVEYTATVKGGWLNIT